MFATKLYSHYEKIFRDVSVIIYQASVKLSKNILFKKKLNISRQVNQYKLYLSNKYQIYHK